MSKLKIEHGISRVKRAKLQTYIDQTVADDIALMSEFTNNEQHYIVTELLRFALNQSEDFQKYKAQKKAERSGDVRIPAPEPPISKAATDPIPLVPKSSSETPAKVTTPSAKVDGRA